MKKALHIGMCLLLGLNIFLFDLQSAGAATTAQTSSILASPLELKAVSGNAAVDLSWNPVIGAASYNVKRSTVNGGPYSTINTSNIVSPSYTDNSVVNGTMYYYVVTAVGSATESIISNQIKATPYLSTAGAPLAPADFSAVANDGSVELSWSAALNATSYTVLRSEASGGPYSPVGSNLTATVYKDASVTNGKQYYYVVSALNLSGLSQNSEEIIVVPATVITVSKDGSGDYSNITDALATIPSTNASRKVIYIKPGTYQEKITIKAPFVSLVGAGRDKTKIIYNDSEKTVNPINKSTLLQPLETATLSVGDPKISTANQFSAENLTIENNSKAENGRALAVLVASDQVVFDNVRIVGYQDTLYAGVSYDTKESRQYYHNSEIKGRTDFIYGPATAAIFDHVDAISVNSSDSSDMGGYVTAAATKNPNGDVPGLVFINSRLMKDNSTKGKHYLGRPWQDQPTVRYINTWMDDHIHVDGWTPMTEGLSTYYLSEYNSMGPGASPTTRKMSSQMSAQEASNLTIPRIFEGWDPSRKIVIPKIFPEVTSKVAPALPDGQLGSYTKPVIIYMEVNGELPEENRVQYRINSGPWTTYAAEFQVSQPGTSNIQYRYVNNSEIATTAQTVTIKIDPNEQPRVPAFPGAEGAGMYTKGGRGAEVYVVDNLNDYDTTKGEAVIPGTIRDAISSGNRTIIFKTSGTINLKRGLDITNSNITIAGQTAPGDGIAISGYMVKFGNNDTGKDIIVRYIRFRNGIEVLSDTADISGNNVIIDHCSFSWSTDETFSVKNRKNFTVQWSIISDSLNQSIHDKGAHGYGGIWGGTNATYHHNLIVNHNSRNPRFDRQTDFDNFPTKIDYRNNVIYNWGGNSAYGGEQAVGINMINNYYKPGPSTFDGVKSRIINPSDIGGGGGAFYIDGNFMEGAADVTADNWVKNSSGGFKAISPDGTFIRKLKPMIIPDALDPIGGPVNTDTATVAYEKVLQSAGASLPKRDSLDQKIMNDVKLGKGRLINTIASDGGLPELNSAVAPNDSDGDGIPDSWEIAHGLNPNLKTDGALISSNGYTNLENYINSLVVAVPLNPNIAIVSPSMHQAFTVNDSIKITTNASSDATNGSIAKVVFYDGDQKIGEKAAAPYEFTWSNAPEGEHYVYAKAVDNNGVMTLSSVVIIYVNGPNNVTPWISKDIGQVSIPGTASLNGTRYMVKGSGDIRNKADSFQYVYQPVQGNFEMIANVGFASEIDERTKAGLMIRDSLDPDAKTTALFLTPDGTSDKAVETSGRKISLLHRDVKGGDYSEDLVRSSSLKAPFWLKIVRDQNTVYGYLSNNSVTWTLVGSKKIDMGDTVYVGMAVDAPKLTSNSDYLTAASFSDVKFTRSALFSISNPLSEAVDIPDYSIKGSVADRTQLTVTNNGVTVVDSVYAEAGASFSYKLNLNEGMNTIIISAKNSELYGNVVNSKTLQVTYNKSAVLFTPASPIPTSVNVSAFNLAGKISRTAAVTVKLNGVTVSNNLNISADTLFNVPLTLQEGINEIVISGIDAYGNTGSKTYQITYNKNWGAAVFTVKNITLKDLSGNVLTGLSNSTTVVTDVTVQNNSLVNQSGVLVVAMFNQQDQMVRYSLLDQSISAGTNKQIKAILKSPDYIMGYTIKAFVWNNITNKTVISNVVTVQ
ncbi:MULTISPECIES: pectinesterase family protein [unclassified Paenibacillus]|uniref:pectinesterase family protein n=1 Tax=unclassified Paenibacillus TaxID=185978 RepID=UPI00362CC467